MSEDLDVTAHDATDLSYGDGALMFSILASRIGATGRATNTAPPLTAR